jgi:hypothetical protein
MTRKFHIRSDLDLALRRARSRMVRLAVALAAALPLSFLPLSPVANAIAVPPGLVLWNKLGSQTEILNSAFGPDLGFFQAPADCNFVGCGPDLTANPAYIPGVFGQALTIGPGDYFSTARVRNVVLRNAASYINTEHGTVEAWYRQTATDVPYQHALYRVFDGGFGLNSGIYFGTDYYDNFIFRFAFSVTFGGVTVPALANGYGVIGYDLTPYNNTWVHLAGVWDRNGIAGSADTVRLYLNGVVVASNTASGWGTAVGPVVDIGGGNDGEIAGKFAVDNLKLWNVARTDFSDRFTEGFNLEQEVAIDVKPHNDANKIQLNSHGLLAVAILSAPAFDATQVDPRSVKFGPGGATSVHTQVRGQDVNGDGRTDLVLQFRVSNTGLQPSATLACLTGSLAGEQTIRGCDLVQISR